jgi:hypothetical protein
MNQISIASANISVAAVKHRPAKLQQALEGLFADHGVVSAGLQEAGQAHKVVRAAAHAVGADVFWGEGRPGEDSTPIVYLKSLKNPKFSSVKLTDRTDGANAGAVDTLHPKYLLTVKYGFNRKRIKHSNLHGIVSQQYPKNDRVAEIQFRKAAAAVKRQKGIRFVSGDFNALPGEQNLAPLAHILVSSQKKLGPINTHKDRAIDDIYCINEKGLFVPKKHFTVLNPGDHKWYVLTGNVG